MEAGTSAGDESGSGYTPAFFAGAVLFTLFFPLFALIGALIMLGGQQDPRKRATLRSWAWASAAWTVVPVVLLIVLASVTFGSSHSGIDRRGPCVGGPKQIAEGTGVPGSKGKKFVMPCEFSGTETVTIP